VQLSRDDLALDFTGAGTNKAPTTTTHTISSSVAVNALVRFAVVNRPAVLIPH
jgi:hypothetical protein